jgi:HSP20 family protein
MRDNAPSHNAQDDQGQLQPGLERPPQATPEATPVQEIPVKVYRSADRLTVAAPMPGLEPEDILVEVTAPGSLILHGELRAELKGVNEVLRDEWSVGAYHRELVLPSPVDGQMANVTYGNGVVVVALPLSSQTRPARLTLRTVAPNTGRRAGNAGHPVQPITGGEHHAAHEADWERHGAPIGTPGGDAERR